MLWYLAELCRDNMFIKVCCHVWLQKYQHFLSNDHIWNYRNCYISQTDLRYLSQLMRFWYLSHRRPAKAQASLRIRAVSPEPSLFAHMKYESRWRIRPNTDIPTGWRLKNEFTEDEKFHYLMSWLILFRLSGFITLILWSDKKLEAEVAKVPKFAFFGVGRTR